MDNDQREFIDRALAYPFSIERSSYLFVSGENPLTISDYTASLFHRRVPVLAYASNQSARQLWTKFRDFNEDVVIPVLKGRLHDFDVVYAAASSQYGCVPATLFPSLGTVVDVSIIWLTDPQLERMHLSEMRGQFYDFVHFTDIRLSVEGLDDISEIWGYTHRNGCLRGAREPIALQKIHACHRRFSALTQEEVLSLVGQRISPDSTLDDLILQLYESADTQFSRTARLREWSLAFDSPKVQ